MIPFTPFKSRLVPLLINNIDTDQIIPARFLKTVSKEGLDKNLFCDWRYNADGSEKPDFILNTPRGKGAQILLAGDNFGCGSFSANMLPWAITQFGFRAVISTSFADIFKGNSLRRIRCCAKIVVSPEILREARGAARGFCHRTRSPIAVDRTSRWHASGISG